MTVMIYDSHSVISGCTDDPHKQTQYFLPARRSKRGLCYSNVSVRPSVTADILSKRLNIS